MQLWYVGFDYPIACIIPIVQLVINTGMAGSVRPCKHIIHF